ncbi:MAG: GNAT family N-acetyltransferase [Gammaproteobacteria bacterium]|nr:GNAT family N-acetyltransferase [Gammaproteobacteria bacterium]
MATHQPAFTTLTSKYPLDVNLSDGSTANVRLMSAEDQQAILEFARGLPEEDLLFLRVDITQPDVVANWANNVAGGATVSIVAYDGDDLVGYATVDQTPARWTRRVGEIRVNVGPQCRAKGLGRQLTAQIFDVARALGLKKLMANMTADQAGAQAAFKRLGFVPEALLADYVEDREGMLRDLVIMSYDVDGFTDQADEPLHL